MRNPFQKRSIDSSDSVTDKVVDALLAQASGGVADVAATGAARSCASLMARAFAQVRVTPENALDADTLAAIGSELILAGRAYRYIDGGELWPVTDVRIGSTSRGAVMYRFKLDLPGRDPGIEQTATADRMVDIRHFGVVKNADLFRSLASLEKWIAEEAASPHGALIAGGAGRGSAIGSASALKLFQTFNRVFRKSPGVFLPLPSESVGSGVPARTIGIAGNLTDQIISLHSRLSAAACSALGVPPSLIDPAGAGGGATRETSRWFQRSTVEPLVRLAEEQLRKLDPSIKLSAAPLGGRDVVSQSRAVKSLTDAGVALDKALALAGFDA